MQKTELIFRGSKDVIVKEELAKKLQSSKPLKIKFGVDPTAGRIHIGRAATIRHLKHFQDLGHEIHIIIGSFTGQIGDSSDKDSERPMLSRQQIEDNMKDYDKQLSKIFDTKNMTIHYNGDWFYEMGLDEFFKLQQMFSVAQMIERDNFAKRFEKGDRIGLHEFSYALLQGYDSVAMSADVEVGGTDQLFNLLAGRTVQKNYDMPQQDIITYELLRGLDGRKMSTTWENCIYVDDTPDDMFGKVMSITDDLMWDYYSIVTEITDEELAEVKEQIASGDDPRQLKARLAHEITAMYHGADQAKTAGDNFDSQFVGGGLPEDIEEKVITTGKKNIVDLLVELGLATSKSEARRLLDQGGIKLNQEKIETEEIEINGGDIISVGKRRFVKIKAG